VQPTAVRQPVIRHLMVPSVGPYSRTAVQPYSITADESRDFTNPDHVGLARVCGCRFQSRTASELREAVDKALKADGPAIVDCAVAADELPNLPHIDLERVENYAKAKVKETILAVTSG
jgi:pyruvate dehydrogenase (quinone)